jgi:hypothetical protein
VPNRLYIVSFKGERGVQHAVEVTAETLYEAAALALSALRQDEWAGAGEGAGNDACRDRVADPAVVRRRGGSARMRF